MIKVSAAIIKENDKILIAQRGSNKSNALKWEFPGGKIEENETPEESLIREIKEELNIDIKVVDFFCENTYKYPSVKIKLLAYNAMWVSGELKPLEHER